MIAEKTKTTQDVANRMSELFKENKWGQVQDELFSEDCESLWRGDGIRGRQHAGPRKDTQGTGGA